ncbi:MAG TPA: hypothetical protein VFL93_06880 [Longimicrobiaceae bacterium]|jgi:hypothetical protein|nr:hypothetical protein [Longimicrobiaceae bacterium]
MLRSSLVPVLLFLSLLGLALAAGLDGKWEGAVKTPDGNEIHLVYTFHVQGDTLTGSVASQYGEIPLENGKVNGDSFSYSLTFGDRPVQFQGELVNDTVHITSQGMDGQPHETLFTRVQDQQ